MDSAATLAAFADWLGHDGAERAAKWAERLEMNRREIDAFRAQVTPKAPAYCAHATSVVAADGVSAAVDEALATDAAAAIERARANADLKAFTWIAPSVPKHGKGLLAGVPIAVKDLMSVAGAPLSGGTRAMGDEEADHDALVVARLKKAGAAVIGLTNLHELAYGITSDNVHFGRVVNPAARDRIPGGSSGGSAAAIAAGIVRLAVGTDTAGSIRIPAACCGVVGFKPSYDAVPRDDVIDLAASLDHVGPLGARVDDCAAMFAAMLALDAMPKWVHPDLARQRIARLTGYFDTPLDAEVRAALDEAGARLKEEGVRMSEASFHGAELAPVIQFVTILSEATAFHADRLRTVGDRFGPDVRIRLEIGNFIPGHWYVKAQRMRSEYVERMDRLFERADFLLCATLRTPAPKVGAGRVDIGGHDYPLHTAVTNLTSPFNLAGLPAVSVPWKRSKDGVPICLQIVGPRGHDWRTLAAARRLEALAPWKVAT
jgi:Asp-tRNA(Asn)/Glu-tRNA(Gln) amidotransferase A subunit family amidase